MAQHVSPADLVKGDGHWKTPLGLKGSKRRRLESDAVGTSSAEKMKVNPVHGQIGSSSAMMRSAKMTPALHNNDMSSVLVDYD